MKTIIYIILCSLSLVCSCTKNEDMEPSAEAGNQRVTVFFDCEDMGMTRTAETRIDDINMFLYPANGDKPRHIYVAPGRSVVLELPKGEYTLFAAANLGTDTGEVSRDYLSALTVERDPVELAVGSLPMTAEQEISVQGETSVRMLLVRAVAKLNLAYSVAPALADELHIESVQLRCVSRRTHLFTQGRAAFADDTADCPKIATSDQKFAATYYLPENCQGENTKITDQKHKDATNAPELATYIFIQGEAAGKKVAYSIYLGLNNTTDFNVVRNTIYNIDILILGTNTVDWRVSTTELSVTSFAGTYPVGETASAELRLTCTNSAENNYYLTYRIEQGSGRVQIDGQPREAGVPFPLFSGNGTHRFKIDYTQSDEGDVRLSLIVTDRYGFRIEREVSTRYETPKLTVSFSQQGQQLTIMDRAYIDFTVSQPGYAGTYKVSVAGTPSVYFGRTGSETPMPEQTIPGNGTYTLRVKPEAIGDNPLTVTITDQKGNTAKFQTSVTGIKMKAFLTPTFSLWNNSIKMDLECSIPVPEIVGIRATVRAHLIGYIYEDYRNYSFIFTIDPGTTSGWDIAGLDDAAEWCYDIEVGDVQISHRPTSQNGLVEYFLN